MTMYQQNREYVLRGLAIREFKKNEEASRQSAAERDAAFDAAESDMHRGINFMSRWNEVEKELTQATERRDRQAAQKKAASRAREKKATDNWNMYMRRCFGSLAVGSVLTILFLIDAICLWLELTGIALAGVYAIANCVAYATRNRRKGGKHHG